MLPLLRAALLALAMVVALVATPADATDSAAKRKKHRPEVYEVMPTRGPSTGGTVITLKGRYFKRTTKVEFDKTPATSFKVVNNRTLQVVAPPHTAGLYRIWVTTRIGRAKAGAFDGYRYLPTNEPPPPPLAPTVVTISPKQGPIGGGTSVTITGTNFTAGTTVVFGDEAATSVTITSSTSITATSPSFPGLLGGTVDVRVTNSVGTSANTTADDFRYSGLLG